MRLKRKDKKTATPESDDSRNCLFQAAKHIFSAKGFDGATIRDLAHEAGCNISLVSYYFQGKEGLYRACLENLSSGGLEAADRILKKPTSSEEFRTRFQIFLEEFLQLHMNERDVSNILLRDFANSNPVAIEIFVTKFAPIFDKLIEFFKAAQKQKIISPEINVEITVMMTFGCITHFLRVQQMQNILKERKPIEFGSIEKVTKQIVLHFCDGILARST